MEWMLMPLRKYAQFSGRSQRKELWMFFLGVLIVYFVLALVGGILFASSVGSMAPGGNPLLALSALGPLAVVIGLFWLAVFLPSLAVSVRRLHDTDRSGWWVALPLALSALRWAVLLGAQGSTGLAVLSMILALVAFVADIVLIVFYCLDGTRGPNRFGPDPKGPDLVQTFA